MKKQFSKGLLVAGASTMLAYGCGDQQADGTEVSSNGIEVALPVEVDHLRGTVCSTECQTPGSQACVDCLIDECKAVAGDMAAMCDQIADMSWDDTGNGGVLIDVDCQDPSDPECAAEICAELCGTDGACLDACVAQMQEVPDDDCSVKFICVDECGSGDHEACSACLQSECETMCDGLPVSGAEIDQCKAACQDINTEPDEPMVCEGGTVAAPSGVTVWDFYYAGSGCPVGLSDATNLVLTNGGTELELELPSNTPDIVADATGGAVAYAVCILNWSFDNVPADMCWSTGEVTFSGQADLGSGGGHHLATSEFAFGAANSFDLELTSSGDFTNTVPANNAICSDQGGGGIYHLHNGVVATAGATVTSEHVQRIPIRWFACP